MKEDDQTEDDDLEEKEDWMTPEERLAFEQAMEWGDRARKLHRRAKEGDQDALSELVSLVKQGDKYAHGKLFDLYKEHHKDAKQRYIKIAAEGCAQAQFNVASRLRFGGESGDEKKALWWAELSAAQGFTRAQALLGVMYYFSETDYNKDLERQRAHYKETGNVYYLNEEKKILRSGYIKQDLDLAFKLFTIAATAEKSNRYSKYMLGKMYENGEGCVKDMETAVYWYKQFLTAPHHDPRDDEQPLDFWIDGGSGVDVEVHLGDIYYYGQGGIRQNYKTAFTHYNAAAKAYDISVYAKYMIATMYERGDGIKQNFEKALKFYKQVFRWSGKTGYRDAQEKVEELSEYLSQQ